MGYRPRLQLGVRRQPDGTVIAHAWVEKDGQVLIGGGRADRLLGEFSRFPEFDQVLINGAIHEN